jgi:hypothetical protein
MKSRHLVRLCSALAVFFLVCTAASTASAYPYELYAKYTPLQSGGAPLVVKIGAGSAKELVPGDPTNAKFNGIYLKPKSDDLAKMELERLQSILLDVYTGKDHSRPAHIIVSADELKSGAEKLVLAPTTFGASVGEIRIEVRPKFTQDFLCQEELALRDAKGAPAVLKAAPEPPKTPTAKGGKVAPAAQATAVSDSIILESANLAVLGLVTKDSKDSEKQDVLYAYTTLFSRALKSKRGEPLVYSFCRRAYDRIDWAAVASAGAKENVTDVAAADAAHARHKDGLANLIVDSLNASGAASDVRLEKHDGDRLPNVYAYLEHNVAVLMDTSDLVLEEVGNGQAIPLPTIVDDDSQVVLNVQPKSHFCAAVAGCNTVFGSKLKVLMTYVDKDKKVVETTGSLTSNGNGWVVAPDLTKYLKQKLSFTIYYAADGDSRLELLGNNYYAQVENLGLVMSAPLVSDIMAAAKANGPSDVKLQSSVPVSWAINLSHSELAHAAITFPWMLGFNTRSAPRLADYLKIFPAASVIFPLESDTKLKVTRLAFGGGIALANAFTFSGAATVEGTPEAFFLIGVSVPDLVKLP